MAKPRLECVRLSDVYDFARRLRESKPPGEPAPISLSRARAWQDNPHAEPDDVVLIVASIEDRIVGYLGLMPARVRIHDQDEKVYWFSTLYVPEDQRNTAVGGLLLMRAVALGYSLAATGSSVEARRTYDALKFSKHASIDYFELDLARHNVLGAPFRLARRLFKESGHESTPLKRAIDASGRVSRNFLYPRMIKRFSQGWRWLTITTLDALPQGNFEAAADRAQPVRYLRDRALLNWMLRDPWVTTNPADDTPDYHFHDLRDHFEYRVLQVSSATSHENLGWMIVWHTSRDGLRDLHVLDYSMEPEVAREVIAVVALDQAREFDAHRIYLPAACEQAIKASGIWSTRFIKHSRPSYCRPGARAKRLKENLADVALHYADGDIGFA